MKKKFIYSLPVLVALAFNGCGSSSQDVNTIVDSTIMDSKDILPIYSVIVERGAVLDANVTDANGSVATQVSDTNNTYIFENEPVYPISAEGGWIDVDGDGNLTEVDVTLDINLTSYSDVITPTTTYCSDENETIRQERLEELAQETNTTVEDLLTVPSKATKNSIMVLNAVYEKLVEKSNTHSKATIAIGKILERYTEIDNNTNLYENATSKEIALAIEEQTMFNLKAQGLVKQLNSDDIKKIKDKKPKKADDEDLIEEIVEISDEPVYLDDIIEVEEMIEVKKDLTDNGKGDIKKSKNDLIEIDETLEEDIVETQKDSTNNGKSDVGKPPKEEKTSKNK